MREFFSNGKLILMGEYAVMHGADALCIPLKTGQLLQFSDATDGNIHWRWTYRDQVLASFILQSDTLHLVSKTAGDPGWVIRLIELIRLDNSHFLREGRALHFINHFPPQWGLGCSSATISSICRLAGVNPYTVNHNLGGGSGSDIASTTAKGWFIYRTGLPWPGIWELPLTYRFEENTWFVYSGTKQATADHIKNVARSDQHSSVSWNNVNPFVYRFLSVSTLPELMKVIYDHELLIGDAIGMESISHRFGDFPGKVKSLGAWGGDFFMVLSQQNEKFVKEYFNSKGFDTIFSWNEMMENSFF